MNNIIGRRFGRLVVKRFERKHEFPCGTQAYYFNCECDCGEKNVIVFSGNLYSGKTRSCGCLRRETCAETGRRRLENIRRK